MLALSLFSIGQCVMAEPGRDTLPHSTPEQALNYLKTLGRLDSSRLWPNIDPALLMQNLNSSISNPIRSFEGKNTNFCSYTALTYIPIKTDPLGFARFIVRLYQTGKARMGKAVIEPNWRVRNAAGTLVYKGDLDINHLAQMWFLSLADHFKGYLNMLNSVYKPGDENKLWAATNFAKFNRMIRRLFGYHVTGRGADLIRPHIPDLYGYLQNRVSRGTVFLFLNNKMLYRKNHEVSRFGVPTHYVVLTNISKDESSGKLTIIYWDAGRKTLQQVTPRFLHKIVYGISFCTPGKHE